jgi:hypothetical protein
MMGTVSTSETSFKFYETTQHNIPEGNHFHGLGMFENRLLLRSFGPKRGGSDVRVEKVALGGASQFLLSTSILRMVK